MIVIISDRWITDPKGLDTSSKLDSRRNSKTFFRLPNMFRRYNRHRQCYEVYNRR